VFNLRIKISLSVSQDRLSICVTLNSRIYTSQMRIKITFKYIRFYECYHIHDMEKLMSRKILQYSCCFIRLP